MSTAEVIHAGDHSPFDKIVKGTPEQLAYTPLQAVQSGERFRADDQIIKISDIILDDSLIADPAHVEELLPDIRENDQHSPLLVCGGMQRQPDGSLKFVAQVADGIHRLAVLQQLGRTEVRANILYGLSQEEVYDQRIMAASRGSVTVARMINWMEKSFQNSEWARFGLTISQVFNIAYNQSSRTNLANMTPDELEGLKKWATKKAERWGRDVLYMKGLFAATTHASPKLIAQLRESDGGNTKVLNVQRLGAISIGFPDEENYIIQERITRISLDWELTTNETKALVYLLKLKGLIEPTMSEQRIDEIIEKLIEISDLKQAFQEMQPKRRRKNSVKKPGKEDPETMRAYIEELEAANANYVDRITTLEAMLANGSTETTDDPRHFDPNFLAYVEDLEQKNATLAGENTALRRGVGAIGEENNDLRAKNTELEELVKNLTSAMSQRDMNAAQTVAIPKVSINPLQTEIARQQEVITRYREINDDLGKQVKDLKDQVRQFEASSNGRKIAQLESDLALATRSNWWKDASYLNPMQRECITVFFCGIEKIINVANAAHISPSEILKEAQEGLRLGLEHQRANFRQAN